MPSLQEIKSRISAVEATRKITKAMNLVATSKLQRARRYLSSRAEYFASVDELFSDLSSQMNPGMKLFPASPREAIFYVIITSDIGLCGGYNNNIIKRLGESFRPEVDFLVVIGLKGGVLLKSQNIKPALLYEHIGDEPNYNVASDIARKALAKMQVGEAKSVVVIYTKFINTLTIESTSKVILPIKTPTRVKVSGGGKALVEFLPSTEAVLRHLLPLYLAGEIYSAIIESKTAEMSARRTAMESATDNAKTIIDDLRLEYNRERQSGITQEISEVVSGAESSA